MAKENDIKKNPESLDMTNQIKMKDRDEFVKDLEGKVQKDISDRATRDEKLTRWYKKRYGIRPSSKTFPWPGASNIHIFLTDEKIRKLKPNYINIAFEGDPVVNFQALGSTPVEQATAAELLMDWVLKYKMNSAPGINYFRALSLTVDRMLEKGKGFAKVIWDYQDIHTTTFIDIEQLPAQIQELIADPLITDEELLQVIHQFTALNPEIDEDAKQADRMVSQFREGKTILKFKAKTVIYNGPRVIPVDDKDLIVPGFTTDIQTANRITHRLYMTENDLRVGARNGKFNKKAVQEVLDNRKATEKIDSDSHEKIMSIEQLQTLKRQREGVGEFQKSAELFEVWEMYTWYDIDNDGVLEKIVTTYHPQSKTVLRMIEFPYNHYKWPFVVFDYELNDDRFYSQRGLPELLDHYQTELTVQENAKLDRMTLANSLQFKYRIGAINPKNIRFIPGQGIPVHRMDDMQELPIQNVDLSFDTEMQKIRGLAESYIGQPDLDIGSMGGGERKTAFQVSEMVSLGKQVFSFDARLFKDSLHSLYDQIFELWMQYGPDTVEVRITGEQPLSLTKMDLIGNFNIVPSGEFTMLSRTLDVQRSFADLQLALNDTSGALDQYNAWELYLRQSNPRDTKRLLRPREQFEQIQVIKQKQQVLDQKFELAKAGRVNLPGQNANTAGGGNIGQ
jgi:hypothetical protein